MFLDFETTRSDHACIMYHVLNLLSILILHSNSKFYGEIKTL